MRPKYKTIEVADSATGRPKRVAVRESRLEAVAKGMRRLEDLICVSDHFKQVTGRDMTTHDASEALNFVVNQLTYEETEMLVKYQQPNQYKDFVPISYAAGPEKETITYYVYERIGKAKLANPNANDMPYTDVAFAQKTFPVKHGFQGYKYTQHEMRVSAFLKRPLPELRMNTAVEAFENLVNEIMLLGNTSVGITGLYNNALVGSAVTPSGKKWDGSDGITVAQLISDFNFLLYFTWLNSGFNLTANTVIVPPGAYQYISTVPASPTIPTITILDYLMAHNVYTARTKQPLMVEQGFDLTTAGAGSTGRAIAYDRNPRTLVGHVPMPIKFLAPQLDGVDIKIPGEFRLSGVEVKRVTNARYMDGIV